MLMFETINPGMLLNMVPYRAGQHIGQCIFSNHLYPPPRREHFPRQTWMVVGQITCLVSSKKFYGLIDRMNGTQFVCLKLVTIQNYKRRKVEQCWFNWNDT